MEGIFLLVPVAILFALVIRHIAGGMDGDRIRRYIQGRGGAVQESRWSPFGPGWFGARSERLYRVRYVDRDGAEHEADCKTSMWTGVYFTEDRIIKEVVRSISTAGAASSLEAENHRLREELERLRRQITRRGTGRFGRRPLQSFPKLVGTAHPTGLGT